jgi:hypothetical protein
MQNDQPQNEESESQLLLPVGAGLASQIVNWYHPGQSRIVDIAGVQITVRFVGRKGRRGRIAITAPAAATYFSVPPSTECRSL